MNDITTTDWTEIKPQKPFYLFVPQDIKLLDEYKQGWKITEMMPLNGTGVITKRDKLSIHFDEQSIWNTVQDFASLSESEVRQKFDLPKDVRDWKVNWAKKDLKDAGISKKLIKPILYRPFDVRYTYYTGKSRGFIGWTVNRLMEHFIGKENIGLITSRQQSVQGIWSLIGVTENIMESCAISNRTKEINYLFPLYLYPTEEEKQVGAIGRLPNFSDEFIKDFSSKLNLEFVMDGRGDLTKTFAPEDIFNYTYAIFHSLTFRSRYSEFLKMDFPRLPLTSNIELFRSLVTLGSKLVNLHLLRTNIVSEVTFPERGTRTVEEIRYEDEKVWINETQYFGKVPESVWEFYIGGYQVLERWLKYRKDKTLSFDDLEHFEKIVSVLAQTIEIMQQIDEIIEDNGSFPIE